MSKVFKSVGKIVKKVAPVAIPIAASFIPGIGPLGMAAAGALGGAAGGGGLKGALLGGLTSGLGAGMFGAAPGISGVGFLDDLNSGLFNAMSPLRSIGSSITSGLGDLFSPLKNVFGAGATSGDTFASAPIPKVTSAELGSPLSAAEANFLGKIPSAREVISGGAESSGGILSKIKDMITNPSVSDLSHLAMIAQSMQDPTPAGMRSQQDILNEMQAQQSKQQEQNSRFLASLNSAPLNRVQTNPNIDYYSYGSRPETPFFEHVGAEPIKFAKGGKVGSPLKVSGGQEDDISAKLSAGEYVIPADVVSGLGDGNTEAGAKQLDTMLKKIRTSKAPALKRGKLPPKAKSPLSYIGAKI